MEAKQGSEQHFYRWLDSDGRLHVVSSLDKVPAADRAHAKLVVLNGEDSLEHLPTAPVSWQPDWTSFVAGFGVALLFAALLKLLPSSMRGLTRALVVVGVAGLLTTAYLGLVRRSAGLSQIGALASPSALISDAQSAVARMNLRQQQQDEELRKLQAESAVSPSDAGKP